MAGRIGTTGRALFAGFMALALAACGGGGGAQSYNSVPGIYTASVSGATDETMIVVAEAVTNAEVSRVTAGSSDGNGHKIFSLNLSPGRTYKFYLVDNPGTAGQRVYPVYQGGANEFRITAVTSFALGFIDTATGTAIPANDLSKVKGVVVGGVDTTVPAALAVGSFTEADLAGHWNLLQLSGGTASRWLRSSFDMDSSGNAAAAPYVSGTESGTVPATTYLLSPGGSVTVQGGVVGSFNGFMSGDKSLIIGTYSPNPGEYALTVLVKGGAQFTNADLAGTWKFNRLNAGDTPAWARGDAGIDAAGKLTGVVTNAVTGDASDMLTIDPSGIVSSSASPSFFGVLSGDRNLVVALETADNGTPEITLFTRASAAPHVTADLTGTWHMNWLTAGNGTSSATYYGRALFYMVDQPDYNTLWKNVNLGGTAAGDLMLSSTVDDTGTVKLKDTGLNTTDFAGIFSPAGTLIIGTMTESNGSKSLYTLMR